MSLEVDPRQIKHGVWTNLAHGPIMGKTITTDTQSGNIIVALLAVLSTLATAHLWHLITFLIHQVRATGRPEDALFRQQQALLRTLPSPSSVMADTIKLWWAWRRRAKRPFLRSLILFVVAMLFTIGTGAASVFSSLVVDTNNLEVLAKSRNCGWAHPERMFNKNMLWPVKSVADPYAKLCYIGGMANHVVGLPSTCNDMAQRRLPFNTSRVPCPFEKNACHPGLESVRYDTGLMDVGTSFGFNLEESSGVKFQRTMTCSLMAYNSEYNGGVPWTANPDGSEAPKDPYDTSEDPSSSYSLSLLFLYGTRDPQSGGTAAGMENVTWAYGKNIALAREEQGYSLAKISNWTNPSAPVIHGFDPRPELRRENTTLTMIFIGLNGVKYERKVYDPLFNATQALNAIGRVSDGTIRNATLYRASKIARALACQEQYQFCYRLPSGQDECTGLGELPLSVWAGSLPSPPNIDFSAFPRANEMQKTLIRLIATSAYVFNVENVATDLEALSNEDEDNKKGLPQDQWLRELSRWQKQVLASLQVAVRDYSTGPTQRDTGYGYFYAPSTKAEEQLCGMQKVRKNGDVVNINVFGLSFIIAFSVLVALLDIFILKFMIYLSKFRAALNPRIDRWIQDGIWQLQRRAYEGEGYHGWTDLEADIPLTTEDKLKDLPILWLPSKSPNLSQDRT